MEYSIILDSGDFFSFLIEKSSHVYNTRRMIQKDNEIFPLLTCARFTIRPPLPFTCIQRLLLLLQFIPLFSTYTDDPIKNCCYLSGTLMFSLKIAFDRVLQIIGAFHSVPPMQTFLKTRYRMVQTVFSLSVQKYCDKFSKC